MTSESSEDRDIYEARLKFAEWDRRALERELRIQLLEEVKEEVRRELREEVRRELRDEVREKGRKELLIDVIPDLQDFAGDPVAEKADLARLTSDELSAILADLHQRLRSRS